MMHRFTILPLVCLCSSSLWAADEKGNKALMQDPGLPATVGIEVVQTETSRKLTQIMDDMKDRRRGSVEVMIEDIIRVTGIDEKRTRLLRIAGRGALDHGLDTVRANIVKTLDDRMKGSNRHNIKKMLDGFSPGYSANDPLQQGIWKESVKQVLTAEERAKWETVVKERDAYRVKALAEILSIEVELRVGLGQEQMQKMEPHLHRAVADYLPDLTGMYASGDGERSIYSEYLPVLVLAVEEKVAKEIIPSKEQWKKWESAPGRYRSNWDWLKRSHDARVASEKNMKQAP